MRPSTLSPRATVLVVDDEACVLRLIHAVLTDKGYAVRIAENPVRALEILREPSTIDVLVTDVVMPQMSGKELACRALELRPGIKIILMAGWSGGTMTMQDGVSDDLPMLDKPFTPQQLLEAVAAVMHERSKARSAQ